MTLVEVIVVMVLLAIAAAVIVPQAVETSDLEVVAAARLVASDLNYAQDLAVTSQSPITVTFSPAANSYTLSNESGSLIHPITKKTYQTAFTEGSGFGRVEVVSATFGSGNTVTFDELGTPSAAGTVILQAGGHVYHVSVAAATGRVTVTRTSS